jgi:hypothetical protein
MRHSLIAALKREFPSHYFGSASPQDMARIYASARLVFNRSVRNDVNMRFFEAAGAGAILVTDAILANGVDVLFDEGIHYFVYRDKASLLDLVRANLADPERCEVMGRAARQRVLDRHTYRHRADSLLETVGQSAKLEGPRPEDYFPVFLALNLLGATLSAAGQAMFASSGGVYRRVMGGALALVLFGLSGLVRLIERLRGR